MDADRVDVLHRTDCDYVSGAVAHYFELNLFPARDTLIDQHLTYRRQAESGLGDFDELLLGVGNTAAGAAECERRTDDKRVAVRVSERERGFDVVDDGRRNDRLTDFHHRVLERLTVLGLVYSLGIRAEQLDTHLVEEAFFGELHTQGQTGLTSERRQQAVGTLFFDDALDGGEGQRLDIYLILHCVIGHDRRRVGVDEYDLKTVFL